MMPGSEWQAALVRTPRTSAVQQSISERVGPAHTCIRGHMRASVCLTCCCLLRYAEASHWSDACCEYVWLSLQKPRSRSVSPKKAQHGRGRKGLEPVAKPPYDPRDFPSGRISRILLKHTANDWLTQVSSTPLVIDSAQQWHVVL